MVVYLAMVLLLPLIIGVIGLVISKGKITIKEFAVLEAAVIIIVGIGYGISAYNSVHDVEVWSGRVVSKKKVWVPCSHSYPCNPYNCGTAKQPMTCWHTCYYHTNDWDWDVYTSNGEVITIDRVDSRGSDEPPRWTAVKIGEPTAQTHSFVNYIKGNSSTVLRKTGTKGSFPGMIPEYPNKVYDYYHVDRFVSVGVAEPAAREWNRMLGEINADLGQKKKLNIVVVAAKTADPNYRYAIEEEWIGGKKNDLLVILGVPNYPKIEWVDVISWSKAENLKVELRDSLLAIGSMEKREVIGQAIRGLSDESFVHRSMKEFEYLAASTQPGTGWTIALFIIGVLTSVGLAVFFWIQDPFGSRPWRYSDY